MKHPIALALLLTALWALGSTWYYDCKIKRVCGPARTTAVQAAAPVPASIRALPLSTTLSSAPQAAPPVLIVHFGRKSTDMLLPAQADATVQALLKAAAAGRKVVISGHSDARGPPELKAMLSAQRAQILHDWLLSRGLPASAVSAVESREDREPSADNATAAGRAENRRAIATLASQE